MKSEIIDYFKNDRTHGSGVALVIRHSPKLALKKQLNIHPENEFTRGLVHEELRQLADLSNDDVRDLLAAPVVPGGPVDPPEVNPAEISIYPPSGDEGIETVSTVESDQPVAPKKASRKK